MNTITLALTEKQLNSLHMALLIADQEARTRLLKSVDGEIRHNLAQNQFQTVQELLSIVVKQLDILNAETI